MKNKRVLITGGKGFIGSNLHIALEKQGHDVSILSRSVSTEDTKTIQIDLSRHDPAEALTKKFDVVFHLASVHMINEMIKYPKETTEENIVSILNLLEDIRLNNPDCLVIFASSIKVYGNQLDKSVTEDHRLVPLTPYGCSKAISELILRMYGNMYGIKFVVLRMGHILGPNPPPFLLIPSIMKQIVDGSTEIKVGNLDGSMNFVSLEDTIDAFCLCMNSDDALGQTFNISSFYKTLQEVTKEVASLSKKLLGREIKYVKDLSRSREKTAELSSFVLDCSKAKKVLGWNPKLEFSVVLEQMFKSFLKR